jgi:hypothetical protein
LSAARADSTTVRNALEAPPDGGVAVLIMAHRGGKIVLVREDTTLAVVDYDGGEGVMNAALDRLDEVLADLNNITGGVH